MNKIFFMSIFNFYSITNSRFNLHIKKKYVDVNNIDMIFSEASALKNLNHKNIVKILEFYTFKNMEAVFVMEYLAGGELTQYLKDKGGKLSEEEAQFFFR